MRIGALAPPGDVEAAVSVVSITELHFGVLAAGDFAERARRAAARRASRPSRSTTSSGTFRR